MIYAPFEFELLLDASLEDLKDYINDELEQMSINENPEQATTAKVKGMKTFKSWFN